MWQELKRISSLTETEIGANIDKDSGIKGFSIEGVQVCMKDEKISVESNGILYDFTREEFNRRPRTVMERMTRIIT